MTVGCGGTQGTGFAFSLAPHNTVPSGYRTAIVTNEHVVEGCTWNDGPKVTVRTHDGDSVESKLWSWDKKNDLALIMVNVYLEPLLEADEGEIGDPAIAIGSPLGIEGSVTVGIISKIYTDAYQTDTAINHGNSGGPLLDKKGDVFGITTLGLGREGLNIAFRPEQLCESLLDCK